MPFVIRPLSAEKYAGFAFDVNYTTGRYYDVILMENGFQLVEKEADPQLEKHFSDSLFGEWLEAPVVFGAFDGEELLGFVEGSCESWHSLFRVSNIFVYPQHRKKGVGGLCCGISWSTHGSRADTAVSFWKRRPVIMRQSRCMESWASA